MLARAVRIDVRRTRLGLFLVPVCAVTGVVARRTMVGPLLVATLGLFVATVVVFTTARRSLGRCHVRAGSGRLQIGENGQDIPVRDVRSWTIDGRTSRVYTAEAGWTFRAAPEQGDALRALLVGVFGPPLFLTRRGSRRARFATTVAVLGLAAAAAGIAQDIPAFTMVGVPAFLFGLAVLGALFQKVRSAWHH